VHTTCTSWPGRSAATLKPFAVEGDGWFDLPSKSQLLWAAIQKLVDREQKRLIAAQTGVANGRVTSRLSESERFGLSLGITCQAVYHAGQVQLIRRLR
jgi:hypothetical protein